MVGAGYHLLRMVQLSGWPQHHRSEGTITEGFRWVLSRAVLQPWQELDDIEVTKGPGQVQNPDVFQTMTRIDLKACTPTIMTPPKVSWAGRYHPRRSFLCYLTLK